MIYLDNAATTPPSPAVVTAMATALAEQWQNPSSGYRASKQISEAIEKARTEVAALIDARPEEVFFTSGGTESNNTALNSVHAMLPPDASLATSQIEHSAILRPMERLEELGRPVSYLPVGSDGRLIIPSALPHALLSLMWANNETGMIQPLDEIVALCKEQQVALHTDAVQVAGKIPISVQDTPVDMLSLSGHKFSGPKGVGALYVRSGFRLQPTMLGGGQERGRRSGTENVPAIIGMGVAAREARERMAAETHGAHLASIRDAFETRVTETVTGSRVNGDPAHRLPTHSHISFDRCEAEGLVILLDERGLQCSSGSACMTGKQQPSHVQLAMGLDHKQAKSSLRFSFSHHTTMDQALHAATLVKEAVAKLRSVQGTSTGPVVVYTP